MTLKLDKKNKEREKKRTWMIEIREEHIIAKKEIRGTQGSKVEAQVRREGPEGKCCRATTSSTAASELSAPVSDEGRAASASASACLF